MIVALVILVLVIGYLIITYNGLVVLRQRVKNAWSQIDVQLKRRYDLVPNLVNTVKGYTKHEQSTFLAVTEARSKALAASGTQDQAEAENQLTGALRSLFAVAESYPELKADANFRQLQEQLTDLEAKIAYARQFYNDTVQRFNTRIQVFPNSLIAGMLGFSTEAFFAAEPEARDAVTVEF